MIQHHKGKKKSSKKNHKHEPYEQFSVTLIRKEIGVTPVQHF